MNYPLVHSCTLLLFSQSRPPGSAALTTIRLDSNFFRDTNKRLSVVANLFTAVIANSIVSPPIRLDKHVRPGQAEGEHHRPVLSFVRNACQIQFPCYNKIVSK